MQTPLKLCLFGMISGRIGLAHFIKQAFEFIGDRLPVTGEVAARVGRPGELVDVDADRVQLRQELSIDAGDCRLKGRLKVRRRA